MGPFSPEYAGSIELAAVPEEFTERMACRVETGLLMPGHRNRAESVVRSRSRDAIAFAAQGFRTAYAIGLNEVELRRESLKQITHHGSFRRWAGYACIHGLALSAVILVAALAWSDARRPLSQAPLGWPLLVGFLAFFGLAWP